MCVYKSNKAGERSPENQMNCGPVDTVRAGRVLVFPCSEETHSFVAPLTFERGKRSCRNKRINKQQGESPGFSLEV